MSHQRNCRPATRGPLAAATLLRRGHTFCNLPGLTGPPRHLQPIPRLALLHCATTGTKRMNLLALRLPLRCGDTCAAESIPHRDVGTQSNKPGMQVVWPLCLPKAALWQPLPCKLLGEQWGSRMS